MPKLYITMLGEFSLSYNGRVISERTRCSEKALMFLEYIIFFKDREITFDKLSAVLWENEEIENPKGALKTLLHRLRIELNKLELDQNVFINRRGVYIFNNSLNYSIDTEEFDRACDYALKEKNPDRKVAYASKAIELYKGDFLPKRRQSPWTNPVRAQYYSRYINLMREVIDFLKLHNRRNDIIMLCERGLLSDPYNEFLHLNIIKSLAITGDSHNAHAFYQCSVNLLRKKHGRIPYYLQNRLEQALKSGDETYDLYSVLDGLSEESAQSGETLRKPDGAFYCEYELFKLIYHLELRHTERYEVPNSVLLVTLEGKNGNEPEALAEDMERLESVISSCLRNSDVYAKYSESQYVLMLHNVSETESPIITERLTREFLEIGPQGVNLLKTEHWEN
ncbi:MAG: hypothetical protein FWH08_07045 [Oscillospiraceae bacterium]|nr:hypothetical protein [Oscillospiraceae bacterium]